MARPKEFERGAALDKALNVFWENGFDGTSVADLLEATGLSRSSLYETFGDKESLFAEALTFYRKRVAEQGAAIVASAPTVREGIRAFLRYKVEKALCRESPSGCLLTNTACAAPDESLGKAVADSSVIFEDALYNLFERGKANGELASDADARRLARFFLTVTYGMNVLSRIRPERAVLEDVAEVALATIGA